MNPTDPTLPADAVAPLRDFVMAATRLAGQSLDEPARVAAMRPLLARLIASDDWLPRDLAQPHPEH
jgi:predicted metal-dependent enzyme (double-stranded beta helix superfamily)